MEMIRKFGTAYCDLPTMMWNVTVLWRPLTLNIDKRCKKPIPIIFYVVAAVISASCFYVYVVSVWWFACVKCTETGDVTAAMVVISLGISSQIGTFKLIFMFLNKKQIRDLVEAYLQCAKVVDPVSRFSKNIDKILKIVKQRAITFWMVIICNGIIYIVKPMFLPGRHLSEDSLVLYGLEPMYVSPNYEIAYCITVFGVIFTCYIPANITAFLIIITGYTEAQMLALSKEIKCLWKDAEENFKNKETKGKQNTNNDGINYKKRAMNEYIERQLTVITKKHMINIDLLRKTESVFKGAIALEFFLLTVALITELLGGLEKTYIEMPFALMQVAMDCLVGQRIMDASIVLEKAVYDSKWEMFDIANRKTVFLILQNSQKTLTLSAGGITMLSFESLMAILKSIYSAYTTLRSAVK